jgi:hypothetical protein
MDRAAGLAGFFGTSLRFRNIFYLGRSGPQAATRIGHRQGRSWIESRMLPFLDKSSQREYLLPCIDNADKV